MYEERRLLDRLMDYAISDCYPFHMPGHKRCSIFPNPYQVDITEIDGFDNLHHPEGILKESMEWAASVYGADRTYYLVNGSSSGILSAVSAAVPFGGTLLMGRNCHKSVYHAVILNHLKTVYGYPQIIPEFGIQGGLSADAVESLLKTCTNIDAVLIVSPTYDGVVSDVEAIANVVHAYGIPLIVDEAHGAHFSYGDGFPVSALSLGADIVVQSLHKTLPSLTQTSLLHVKSGYVDIKRLERYLQMYQTSSPSYVLMASMEQCLRFMEEGGNWEMEHFYKRIGSVREKLSAMNHLKLLGREQVGRYGVYDLDCSKVVVSSRGTEYGGEDLSDILRDRYHLEMEMCGADYITAITTFCDSEEGLDRLVRALQEIDAGLTGKEKPVCLEEPELVPESCMDLWEAQDSRRECLPLSQCVGRVSAEFLYFYPPGIPVVAPGEKVTDSVIRRIETYKAMGLPVQGVADRDVEYLEVVYEEK